MVFDLDGTLTYVEPVHRRDLINAALAKVSDAVLTQDEVDRFWFDRRRDALLREYGTEPEKFWAAFNEPEAIAARMGFVEKYDDVEVLGKLGGKYALALLSNTFKPVALQEIEKFGLRKFFKRIILPSREVKKPHPSALRSCLLEFGIAPGEAVMVGDADEDLIAAKRNRVLAVLVERKKREHSISPDYVIHGLEELDV